MVDAAMWLGSQELCSVVVEMDDWAWWGVEGAAVVWVVGCLAGRWDRGWVDERARIGG